MFPFRFIVPGALLLLLAATGFIYVLARQQPPLESLDPVELRLAKATPAPTIEVEEPPPTKTSITKVVTQQPPPIKTFAVNIITPRMAETFTAPANVILKASASRQSELRSIEFFRSPDTTVCQSLTNPEPLPAELKIGEVQAAPYEFTWNIPEPGPLTIIAVATYEGGEKQISPPVVFVVDPAEPRDGLEWKGWKPPYPTDQRLEQDFSIMPAPTPTTTRDSCPAIVVKSFPVPSDSNTVNFQATVTSNEVPADLTYKWTVSAGKIVSGEGTSAISVVFDRILEPQVVAAVEIGHLPGICPTFGSASVAFEQPRWITKELRGWLRTFSGLLTDRRPVHRYIAIYSERDNCMDPELINEARLIKRYLMEYQGVKGEEITIVNGGVADPEFSSLSISNIQPGESLREDPGRPLTPCRGQLSVPANVYAPPLNRTCPDVDEKIKYQTSLEVRNFSGHASYKAGARYDNRDVLYWSPREYQLNTCPFNPRDPINTETQLTLDSVFHAGTYSNLPTYEYWANAGRILSRNSIGIWDLSEVRLQPGLYTVIAKADDGCDCTNINTAAARVTNFCSPCLTMRRTCPSSTATPGRQFFSASIGRFAVAEKTTFHWTTTKGTIIAGQGTPHIVIDTTGLPNGEKFEVTVSAGGLLPYCVNKISVPTVVGEFKCVDTRPVSVAPAWGDDSKRARRRPPGEVVTETITEEDSTENHNGSILPGPPRTKGKEWMQISWTPRVKTDESVTVKVVYNRSTESFQVSDAAGNISEELKLGKLLTEWFGADYQTFGDVRLLPAGLRCDSCDKEQYQSFDKEKLEWSWPLKPEGAGIHSFNIELWVKGEPRDKNSGHAAQPAEKVWTRLENRVVVKEPILTRQTVYAGGGLCAVLGLGLCLRGLKIYRVGDTYHVGQAVAVGHNVTMTNTTVNQEAGNNNVTNKENRDD